MEYRKVKYDEKEIEITFKNDMIFKGLFSLYDSSEFLKFFINSITGRNFHSFELKRNEVSGENWDDKVFYFDIFAKDEEGRDVIIEMQNSIIGKIQTIRFQVYACRVISNKVYKGMDYSEVTSVDVIIITSERFRNQLYSKATLKFENGDEVEGNLSTYHIVSLPFINDEIKGKSSVSDLELLAYIFENGIDNDIIKLASKSQKEMIQYMEKSYLRMVNDNPYFTQAELEALKEWEEYALAKEKEQLEQKLRDEVQKRKDEVRKRKEVEQKLKEANERIAKLQQLENHQ